MTRLLPMVAALSAALFLAMTWYVWTQLVPGAGGQVPFDARVFGYSPDEALTYLTALDGTGRAVYLLEMRWIDRAFPPVFALTLGLWVWLWSQGRALWLRALMILPVLAYLGADLAENACVQEMLHRDVDGFNIRLAEWASLFTRAKFGFLLVAALILGGLRFGGTRG